MEENNKISNGVKKFLIFITFAAGYLIMSLELLGFRLLAPYFGYSIYVWGSLIGLILAALATGYYLGGWLAEKKPGAKTIQNLFSGTAVFLLIILFVYQPILKYLSDWGVIWGALAATFLIFLLPMIFLAAVSPIVIKILSHQEKTGYWAGLVYAWATLGSLLGTFLAAFILIPYLGSRLTLYSCFFLALVIFVVIILAAGQRKMLWLGLLFFISLPALYPKQPPAGILLETESLYNQIRLIDTEKFILLTLNSQRHNLSQSAYVKQGTLVNLSLIDLFNLGPLISPVRELLVLGMAGGASVRQHQRYAPQAKIDAVEIDPKIIEIARTRFGIQASDSLKIYEADARPFLAQSQKKYDMIEIDLFQGSPYLPFYVATREFFQSAYEHLNPSGLIMMNIYAPGKKEILASMLATISSVFPSVYTIPISDNFMVVASRSVIDSDAIKEKIKNSSRTNSPDLKLAADYALDFIKPNQADKKAPVFSDDWAPVELITYQMLKNLNF